MLIGNAFCRAKRWRSHAVLGAGAEDRRTRAATRLLALQSGARLQCVQLTGETPAIPRSLQWNEHYWLAWH